LAITIINVGVARAAIYYLVKSVYRLNYAGCGRHH